MMRRLMLTFLVAIMMCFASVVAAQDNGPAQPVAPAAPELPSIGEDAPFPTNESVIQQASEPPQQGAGTSDIVPSMLDRTTDARDRAMAFLKDGGPTIWAIAALSIITVALILWKLWRLALIGAWSRGKAGRAVDQFAAGHLDLAEKTVAGRMGIRSKVAHAAIRACRSMPESKAKEETTRVAKKELANAGTGLRALELIATIAPLLGLLGTVLGMIAAFQALQESGNNADPALLAGGIWEALLTTAAGMAVAIPASVALTWFEAVIDRIRRDIEDNATRIFLSPPPAQLKMAAE
ncbi:MAG: MotA/TolQ/ExbB proton channel family protein [Pseudomonadota bacterium]